MPQGLGGRGNFGSVAMFAAMRRASSRKSRFIDIHWYA
jgi:hypothetical protein